MSGTQATFADVDAPADDSDRFAGLRDAQRQLGDTDTPTRAPPPEPWTCRPTTGPGERDRWTLGEHVVAIVGVQIPNGMTYEIHAADHSRPRPGRYVDETPDLDRARALARETMQRLAANRP